MWTMSCQDGSHVRAIVGDREHLPNFLTHPGGFRRGLKVLADGSHTHFATVFSHELSEGSTLPCLSFPHKRKYTMSLHPNGLSPLESAKAWYLRVEGKKPWWRNAQEGFGVTARRVSA